MLRVLAKDPGDFVAAFRTLPLKLRELFVQAYQSYLFNKVLSRRLLSGMSLRRAEVGDFAVAVDNTGVLLKATATRAKESDIERMNERLKAGRMRVCIPLFGSRPHFSGGRQGEIERSVFEEENVSTVGFEVEDMPEIGSRGGLRAVLSPTSDLVVQSSLSSISTGTNVSVNFSLQKGCYATVVLRELMKLGNPREAGF
jgi:tRNA pseudouridine13 synthase